MADTVVACACIDQSQGVRLSSSTGWPCWSRMMVLKLSPEQMTISIPPFEKVGIVLTEKNENSISGINSAATTILRMSDCLSFFNIEGEL